MSGTAISRLIEDRKAWRRHQSFGFVANPSQNTDGTLNLMKWQCVVPGKQNTPWEGGKYKFTMTFNDEYPSSPPYCIFKPVIFHPNVCCDGYVCFSTLGPSWHTTITIKTILLGIQQLLNEPNANSPMNEDAANLYQYNIAEYDKRVRDQAKQMA